MVVSGYKCFNEDFTNKYGIKFCVGKIYTLESLNKLGFNIKRFHLCKNMEDTFKYFDAYKKNVRICEVIGSGNIVTYADRYHGYYDMYSVEKLEIKKELSRDEIIDKGLSLDITKVARFIKGFRLNSDEIDLFKEKFKDNSDILTMIDDYQKDYKKFIVR